MTKTVRTKNYNPECNISVRITGGIELFEEARRTLREKARAHKKRSGQDLSYEISKTD